MPVARCILLALLFAAEASAASRGLTVRGQVSHARLWTKVRLFAIDKSVSPLVTLSDHKGRFSFSSVPEGSYALYVNVRGIGSASRTVVVSEPLADDNGAITADLPVSDFNRLAELRQHVYVVSVRQLSDDPYLPPREFTMAQQDLTNGELERAQNLLMAIVTEAPKFAAGWDELAYAAVMSGNYAQAETEYRWALATKPEDITALLGMGRSLIERNRFSDALEYHRRAVAEQPRNAVAQARLGFNYFELGNLSAAEECLLSAERIDPANYTRPQLLLAEIYFRQGQVQAASGQLADYVKRFPGEEDAAAAVRTRSKSAELPMPVGATLTAGR